MPMVPERWASSRRSPRPSAATATGHVCPPKGSSTPACLRHAGMICAGCCAVPRRSTTASCRRRLPRSGPAAPTATRSCAAAALRHPTAPAGSRCITSADDAAPRPRARRRPRQPDGRRGQGPGAAGRPPAGRARDRAARAAVVLRAHQRQPQPRRLCRLRLQRVDRPTRPGVRRPAGGHAGRAARDSRGRLVADRALRLPRPAGRPRAAPAGRGPAAWPRFCPCRARASGPCAAACPPA
mmetsp:Transcript_6024/g.24019  ORF Transcript_6024/g.24019 Transcript_6024/m.24019 type:complete len:240 (+) Transcript_6024:318-1037(+)